MATQSLPVHADVDGIAPGVDLDLLGKTGYIEFSGHFFAEPEIPTQTFKRPVNIVFASPEVYVAYDPYFKNLYVVDREKNLSLGCRMTAKFIEK